MHSISKTGKSVHQRQKACSFPPSSEGEYRKIHPSKSSQQPANPHSLLSAKPFRENRATTFKKSEDRYNAMLPISTEMFNLSSYATRIHTSIHHFLRCWIRDSRSHLGRRNSVRTSFYCGVRLPANLATPLFSR